MSKHDVETESIAISEAEMEAARADREGLSWWIEELTRQGALETAQISNPPSATPISPRAFDLIVEFEVSSKQTYEAKYRGPIWPQGESGVTIGIGYDVGYAGKPQLHDDWQGAIPGATVKVLERALGVKGAPARGLAAQLKSSVDVPWTAAITVHRSKVLPRWVGLVEGRLSNTGLLGPDSLGALVSLTYNRGASFAKDGDRYREMRAIKSHMAARTFERIAGEFRAMKRLWPAVPGLQNRREREARLFETGLVATPAA